MIESNLIEENKRLRKLLREIYIIRQVGGIKAKKQYNISSNMVWYDLEKELLRENKKDIPI